MLEVSNTFQTGSPVVTLTPNSVATPSFSLETSTPLATSEGRSVFARACADVFAAQRKAPRRREKQEALLASLADSLRLYPLAVPLHIPYCAPAVVQWPMGAPRRVPVEEVADHVLSVFPHMPRVQVRNALEIIAQAGVSCSIDV